MGPRNRAAAGLVDGSMWTNEWPTVPGWYWFWSTLPGGSPLFEVARMRWAGPASQRFPMYIVAGTIARQSEYPNARWGPKLEEPSWPTS